MSQWLDLHFAGALMPCPFSIYFWKCKTVLFCYTRKYCRLRNTKLFGRRADGRNKLNDVISELNSSSLDDAFHKTHTPAFRYSILCGNYEVYENGIGKLYC